MTSKTTVPTPTGSPPLRTGQYEATHSRSTPGRAGVSPRTSTSTSGDPVSATRMTSLAGLRQPGEELGERAPDVRLRRQAVDLRQAVVDAQEAALQVVEPEADGRAGEDHVEAAERLAGVARGALSSRRRSEESSTASPEHQHGHHADGVRGRDGSLLEGDRDDRARRGDGGDQRGRAGRRADRGDQRADGQQRDGHERVVEQVVEHHHDRDGRESRGGPASTHLDIIAANVPGRRIWRTRRSGAGSPAAMTEFKKGDKVKWNSHGGTAVGTVERKITSDTEAGGRTVRASKEEPQYLVKSEKSGGTAVHKPDALTKV